MKKATGKANGKIIIIGEHAVVHGYPSVALPFHAVEMTVTIEQIQTNAYLVSDLYEGPLHQAPSAYTDIGPPDRIIPLTLPFAMISSAVSLCDNSSE